MQTRTAKVTTESDLADNHDNSETDGDEKDEKLSVREASLKLQLAALEDAFALQERILAENGREAAMKSIAAASTIGIGTGTLAIRSEKSMAAALTTTAAAGDECSVECFPYLKLLQLWRRQAQRSTLERLQVASYVYSGLLLFDRCIRSITTTMNRRRNGVYNMR
jgi:hypothetical protein